MSLFNSPSFLMQGGALLGGVNALHTSFPENPREQYQIQCELLLDRLGLQDLLMEELQRLERQQNEECYQSPPGEITANNIHNSNGDKISYNDTAQPGPSGSKAPDLKGNVSSASGTTKLGDIVECPAIQTPGKATRPSDMHSSEQTHKRVTQPLYKKNNEQTPGTVTKPSVKEGSEQALGTRPLHEHSNEQTWGDATDNHSKEGNHNSLGWFDALQNDKGIRTSPLPIVAGRSTAIKPQPLAQPELTAIGNLTHDKEVAAERFLTTREKKDAGGLANKIETQPPDGWANGVRTSISFLPDVVVTERVSKKWQKLRLDLLCVESASNGSSLSEPCQQKYDSAGPSGEICDSSSGPLHSSPPAVRGRKRNLAQMGQEKGRVNIHDPEASARLAQLARFSFKQRSKLAHSPEIVIGATSTCLDDTNVASCLSEFVMLKDQPHAQKLQKIIGGSNSEDRTSTAPEGMRQKEFRDTAFAMKEQNTVSNVISPLVNTSEEKTLTEGSGCRKVSSSTLAKLAKFSFSLSPESKGEESSSAVSSKAALVSTNVASAGVKRKCFELEPPTSKSLITSKSLFSTTDIDDETLDFDWEEEIKRKRLGT
ncbi:hypothetical protein FKM82_019019 [Ascaphus truei]